jgi:tetratricopeptide (TPR) repeat protein
MNCPRAAAHLFTVFAVVFTLLGQEAGTATLQGSVHDSKGRPAIAAKVVLKTGNQTFSADSDSEGMYHFSALQPGAYTLHAVTGDGEANFGPFVVTPRETRKIDLKPDSPNKPQFFDPPSFIVAGVTDASERGGHGSDTILHSAEVLAKATASLGADASEIGTEGNALEAVREYQRAAELDPSESHLFDWGSELLKHRAADQAGEVFSQGIRLFPRSTRMLLGLAVSFYSRGSYDQAERLFFEAADLNPADTTPYLFMGQSANGSMGQSAGFIDRMERFARLTPENPWANYYLAMCVANQTRVQALLTKAVGLDPQLGAAWLQLGILYSDRRDYPEAISAWERAAATGVIEAHYRLAQAYRRIGEAAKASHEVEIYRELSKQSAGDEERQRAGIQEFVFSLREQQRQ